MNLITGMSLGPTMLKVILPAKKSETSIMFALMEKIENLKV